MLDKLWKMARKAKGKYAAGQEPHVLLGIERAAFYKRMKMAGPLGDEAREAQRRALEIAGEDVEHEDVAPIEAVEAAAAPAPKPEDVKASGPITPSEPIPREDMPAATSAGPVTPSETLPRHAAAAPVATVNVTLRSRVDQHERLRRMSFDTRRPIQDLVSVAVDEYLARSKF